MFLPIADQLAVIKRGIVDLIPEDELVKKLENSLRTSKPLKVKLGCDPSRPDLHIGHSVVLRKLRQFQDLGHQAILVIGDFTGMIGDPTGKNKTRPSLSLEETRLNGKSYLEQASKILDAQKTKIVYNSDWLGAMNFADVVKLASRYTVARMLERDDFENRYRSGEPISIHEFLYPLAQGMDSVALEADVELGGTDQRFNLLVGRDLQREYQQQQQVIITMPLLEGTDGVQKMSKSLNNYIGIDDSPKEMFGRAMSIPDALIYKYFELTTNVDAGELHKIKTDLDSGTVNPSHLKRRLAKELISIYHDAGRAQAAEEEFDLIFKKKEIPEDIPVISLNKGTWIISKLLLECKLVESGKEAQRQIQQGAVNINGEKITDERAVIQIESELVIKVGKRKFLKIIPT
ncbi:tyrosine--tRNA ligase [bacterium]|nr:tyrosine--tRNA ligase [bacterium]NUN46205.1 tyrosine--tRNA ligase [bacterium]